MGVENTMINDNKKIKEYDGMCKALGIETREKLTKMFIQEAVNDIESTISEVKRVLKSNINGVVRIDRCLNSLAKAGIYIAIQKCVDKHGGVPTYNELAEELENNSMKLLCDVIYSFKIKTNNLEIQYSYSELAIRESKERLRKLTYETQCLIRDIEYLRDEAVREYEDTEMSGGNIERQLRVVANGINKEIEVRRDKEGQRKIKKVQCEKESLIEISKVVQNDYSEECTASIKSELNKLIENK